MRQFIKNIILGFTALLYLSVSTFLLLQTFSPRSFYTVLMISESTGEPLPAGTKIWIQRNHIPLTVKVTGITAMFVDGFTLNEPEYRISPLLIVPEQYCFPEFRQKISNKSPPNFSFS